MKVDRIIGSHSLPSCRDRLIDVLLLRRMHANERLDRFDHTLSITDQVVVNFLQRQILDNPGKQAGKVQDLAMCAAHSREAMAICKELCELGVNVALIIALVLDDLL